ncbi:MYXO-CTERM sorting domain-containing protein [Kitasatospora sp. NPDC059648]
MLTTAATSGTLLTLGGLAFALGRRRRHQG